MHHYAIISPQYHKDILDKSLPVRLFIFLIFFRRRVLYIFIFFRRQVVYIYNILRNFQIFLEYLFINQSQSRTVFSTNHITAIGFEPTTKWLWVRIQLQSLNLQISRLLRARSSLTFRQL